MKRLFFVFVFLFVLVESEAQRTKRSVVNSSSTLIDAAATWTGAGENVENYESVITKVITDQDGELYMEFSPDNSTWYPLPVFNVSANATEVHRITITSPYYRARFVNTSASNQTLFNLITFYGAYQNLTSGLGFVISQDADATVTKGISQEFLFASGKVQGIKVVDKFGQNADVDAAEDIWYVLVVITQGFHLVQRKLLQRVQQM